MGYTTYFTGAISIDPPLNEKEIKYLTKFADTRRMDREKGPYYVGAGGVAGQAREDDIRDYNRPSEGQPGLWCQWVPADIQVDELDTPILARSIEWDGGEKFYYALEWMQYLVDHFIGNDPIAKKVDPEKFDFLQGHTLNGEILAEGEEQGDIWKIIVEDNVVTEKEAKIVWD